MKNLLAGFLCLIILQISLIAQSDFSIAGSTNQEHEPVIAYNSVNNEYLVVWSEMAPLGGGNYLLGGVYGQRISSTGQKIGSAFTIFDMATSPSVAYCSTNNEYVVVAHTGTSIDAQRISNIGIKIANSVLIDSEGGILPKVLYNNLLDEYAIFFYDRDYWVERYTADLQFKSGTTGLDPGISDSTYSVCYAPITANGQYLLSTSSRYHLLLDYTGNKIKSIVLETGYPKGGYVDGEGYSSLIYSKHAIVNAAFGYKDGKAVFMVVYADNNNKWIWPEREGVTTELLCGVWGGYIDAVNPPDQVTDSYFPIGDWLLERNCLARWKPKVVYNNVAKKFIVAWNETPTTASGNDATVNHIRATDKFANEIGFVNTVLSTKNNNVNPDYPVIATSTKSNKAFVVWEDHRNSSTNDIDLYGSMYSFTITPPTTTVPIAPDNLVAILSPPNTINITWRDNSNNEDEFHLEKKDPDTGTWTEIGILSVNTTSYIDPGLELGKTYYYRVRAKNSIGFSGYSNEGSATTSSAITIPTAPSNLTATLSLPTTIDLLWYDNSNNEEAFHIERKESASGTWSEIAVLGANLTYLTDPGLEGGKTFYYRLRAKNSAGFSAYSNEASATTPLLPLAPSNLTATLNPPNTINISWQDNSNNEDAFHLERKDPYTGIWSGIKIQGANTTSYSDLELESGKTYYYRVRAKNSAGFSAYSNEASATTNVTTTSITVISPNGGEVWSVDSQQEIKWTSTNFTGPVRIDFMSMIDPNSAFYTNIVANTSNDGFFTWALKATVFLAPTPLQGWIRVADAAKNDPVEPEDGKIYDWSDNYFTVNPAENTNAGINVFVDLGNGADITFDNVTVAGNTTSNQKSSGSPPPDGFQIIPSGSPVYYDINTTATFTGNITISIKYDDTGMTPTQEQILKFQVYEVSPGSWKDITTSIDVNANIISGEVNHLTDFAVMSPTGANESITVVTPNGNENWLVGTEQEIKWTSANITGQVKIEYSIDGNATHLDVINSTNNDGSFMWTVPNTPSTQCAIIISDETDGDPFDVNDAYFIISSNPPPVGGKIIVTNTDDSGTGSFRDAIQQANTHVGMDTILFQIPKGVPGYDENMGVWTIEPQTSLSAITDEGLLIDGFSQAVFIGEDVNPNGPEIQVNGLSADQHSYGFYIKASMVDIFGISINDFGATGIFVEGVEGGRISGCYVGCGTKGDAIASNEYGIILSKTRNFHITPADTIPNVISGNTNVGIMVSDTSLHNLILGNIIGLDKNCESPIPNGNKGGISISFESDSNAVVDNLISGNRIGVGIYDSDKNFIANNLIGTNYEWELLGNEFYGIHLTEGAQHNLIKENVIAHNGGSGVSVWGAQTLYNTITRNSITNNGVWGIDIKDGGNETLAPPQITNASYSEISGTATPNSTIEIFTDPEYQGIFFHDSTIADASGNFSWSGTIESQFTNITATATDVNGNTSMFSDPIVISSVNKDQIEKPESFALSQNYPNPFNPSTIIEYQIPEKSFVNLKVYDILGNEIAELVNEEKPIGIYRIKFDGLNLSNGVYFYRIKAGSFTAVKKLLLIK